MGFSLAAWKAGNLAIWLCCGPGALELACPIVFVFVLCSCMIYCLSARLSPGIESFKQATFENSTRQIRSY